VIADFFNTRLQRSTLDGSDLGAVGTAGTGNGQFQAPWGLWGDAAQNLYVTDVTNRNVQKFDANFNFVFRFGGSGLQDGKFNDPRGVAVDSAGNIYVASDTRVQKFDANGNFLLKWGGSGSGQGQFNTAEGIFIDAVGNVYVGDSNANGGGLAARARIQKFNSSGVFLAQIGTGGTGDGQFTEPSGVSVDSSGSVYVTDATQNRVQKFACVR
jgi:DNA-binding beta-propeller fold protein YncE